MIITRQTAHAPRTAKLAADVAGVTGPCIGCPGCAGLCAALIEVLTVPATVLRKA